MLDRFLDPKNDLAFKKIFGEEKHKNIPISFLNAALNLEGEDRIADLEFLPTSQIPEIAIRKESAVDVLVRDQKGVKYIVEMQVAKVEGFEKRAQYYAAKAYCSHFKVGGEYEYLRKVIFLAITSYILFPDKEDYKSVHVTSDKKTFENDLKGFSFTFVELPKFTKTFEELETVEDKWYYFLKHTDKAKEMEKIIETDAEICSAHHILNARSWTEEELQIYDDIIMAIADRKGVLKCATKEAHAKGHAEGIAEGIAEGKHKQAIAIAKKMLKMLRPIDEITAITGLTQDELEKDLSETLNH